MKHLFFLFATLFLCHSGMSQNTSVQSSAQEKAQQVCTLLYPAGSRKPAVKSIKIMKLIDGFNRSYDGKWLDNVTAENGMLILRKEEGVAHYWFLEDAILIEGTKDEIVIRI
ncbi:MAG: hypothetical protein MI810_05580 [Flavobacteriales bacterium]|jgi:hypothetical protein|nr:hypothetical protein [Flavobacteriales bacterium]